MMEEEKNKIENTEAGEKGLAQMITQLSNNEWKMVMIGLFKDVRENPKKMLKEEKIFSEEEKLIWEQHIDIKIITEAISYMELLGVYLLAFSKKEKVIQKVLLNYEIPEIEKMYKKISLMNCDEVIDLIGYPPIDELSPETNLEFIEEYKKSSLNLKKVLVKIADFYLKHKQFYNDYKHGFRIFPTTSSPPNSSLFGSTFQIIKGESLNKIRIYHSEFLRKISDESFELSNRISTLLGILIPIFRERFIENKNEFTISLFNDIEKETDEK